MSSKRQKPSLLRSLRATPGWSIVPLDVMSELVRSAVALDVAKRKALFTPSDFDDDKRRLEGTYDGLYVVRSGLFKVRVASCDGREQVLYFAGAGKIVTEGFVPGDLETRASMVALTRGASAWRIDTERVVQLMAECPPLVLAVLRSITHRVVRTHQMISDTLGRRIDERMATFLLEQVRRIPEGKALVLPRVVTVDQLSMRLGTVRSEAGRALIRLERAGIIVVEKKRVIVRDVARLEHASYGLVLTEGTDP